MKAEGRAGEVAREMVARLIDLKHPIPVSLAAAIEDELSLAIPMAQREAEKATIERCAEKFNALASERAQWAEPDETGLVILRNAAYVVRALPSAYGDSDA